ncbi:hypothetical protein L2E82_11062 [Cichorium intybus]|uniref:Uncharacterized protein n=1 Tax=Cichorium intybus TaxID=13427 RepID=A0ACB9GCZ6_CICIN|nr:hypothetical protein L2E82_11062 [Cichorium intybus]
MEGKVFEQFLNTDPIDKEKERKEVGEWEGDDRNWLSDDGESENSAGEEEEVDKSGAWKKSKSGGKFEESFVAESRESAQDGKNNNGKKIWSKTHPSPCKDNEGEPMRDVEGEFEKGVDTKDITALQRAETQRKIRMKEGRVNNSSEMEKRVTRSQSRNWKKKNEAEDNKKGGENVTDSDSSMSIGIIQILEEVGRLSGLRKEDERGSQQPSIKRNGSKKGDSEKRLYCA